MLTKEQHSESYSENNITDNKYKARYAILIDDDEVTNFVNKELFIEPGLCKEVYSFENAALALAFIKSQKVASFKENEPKDLVFLDINMPGMNGFEFLEKFRSVPNLSRIIILVMLGTSLNKEDMEKMKGFNDLISQFIEKPLTRDSIIGIVNKYL
jgi:CheY-like chemotaxis protein